MEGGGVVEVVDVDVDVDFGVFILLGTEVFSGWGCTSVTCPSALAVVNSLPWCPWGLLDTLSSSIALWYEVAEHSATSALRAW